MPRRSSAGRSAPRPPPRAARMRNPPRPAENHAPPATVQGGGSLFGGIGSTIAQGMAFGTGSAVAHRAVDTVLGPRTIQHETAVSQAPEAASAGMGNAAGADLCNNQSNAFLDCINNYGNDISKCQFYLDMLSECRRGSSSGLGA